MKRFSYLACAVVLTLSTGFASESDVPVWTTFEIEFESSIKYENPLYDLEEFYVTFRSPTEKTKKIRGFWDGGRRWRVRFAPGELGQWSYLSSCSDENNPGLQGHAGTFEVVPNQSPLSIYRRGSIVRPEGRYHLTYSDGTPFFWVADTAWNGALKSTDEEWEVYLNNRKEKGFNVIQFVTTQWRGAESDRLGQVAFQGSGRIKINPSFFKRLDRKIDRINQKGLVAAPVLLWALPFGAGRHLSPGYYLPHPEAIRLARYMVARYGGHQVIWILGGDGRYVDDYEQRWKEIGRGVFSEEHPGIVAQHPHGRSWIGDAYIGEDWLDIVGYQSSHSVSEQTISWITKGPPAQRWNKIPARPVMNLEPIYEQILEKMSVADVRKACYWSLFAGPPSGLTYGANGIWPWLREGEKILNHRDAPWTDTWQNSLDLPGSEQIGYLSEFIQKFDWWELRPGHNELLVNQPGDTKFDSFVSVLKSEDYETLLIYMPRKIEVEIRNHRNLKYTGEWFNPETNEYTDVKMRLEENVIKAATPRSGDMILILRADLSESMNAEDHSGSPLFRSTR